MITQIRGRSQVTLPSEIVRKMKLHQGDPLDIVVEDDRIIIKPIVAVERSQAWFWSKEWQAMEKEAENDIQQGRLQKAGNLKELIKKLDS